MTSKNQIAASSFLVLALFATGCDKKKKKQAVVPPPTIVQSPATTNTSAANNPPAPATSTTTPATTTITQTPPQNKPVAKPKPVHQKPAHKPAPQKPPASNGTTTAANTAPPRITIDNGGSDAQPGNISSTPISHTEEAHHRMSVAQLNQSTEDNLRSITRQLTPDEQSIVSQVRSFMAQANAATKDGDVIRAHNLALKAHLLSDELVRR